MEKQKWEDENLKRNKPYVLCNDLLGGVREVEVDEIGEQRHSFLQGNRKRKAHKSMSFQRGNDLIPALLADVEVLQRNYEQRRGFYRNSL